MKDTYAIIQARVGSSRLPGKTLLTVNNKPILEYVVERVQKARNLDGVFIATSVKEEDLAIVALAKNLGVKAYQGPEDDVLDRFYRTAKLYNMRHIVRITADCPLIDPQIIDQVVEYYFKNQADYCSNVLERTFPDGEDTEVFSFQVLEDAWKNAQAKFDREHVTTYIRDHPDKFKLVNLKNNLDLSAKRWTLDREDDFLFIKNILESVYPLKPDFEMQDILTYLKNKPGLENINKK